MALAFAPIAERFSLATDAVKKFLLWYLLEFCPAFLIVVAVDVAYFIMKTTTMKIVAFFTAFAFLALVTIRIHEATRPLRILKPASDLSVALKVREAILIIFAFAVQAILLLALNKVAILTSDIAFAQVVTSSTSVSQ